MIYTKAEILRRMEMECPELKSRMRLDFTDNAMCELLALIVRLQAEAPYESNAGEQC